MALPESVRVKLSSEAAESISLTRVILQDLPLPELLEHILAIAGKDVTRIQEILQRGSLVTGASRFRWAGFKARADEIREALAQFPDSDPSLPFAPERCFLALLRGSGRIVEVPREAATRKGLFAHSSFWGALMSAAGTASYSGYSYKDGADRYIREFSPSEIRDLREAAGSLKYSVLRDLVRSAPFSIAEYLVRRA